MTRKNVNLVRKEQIESFENAKDAVASELGEDPSDGDVVRELSRAYTGYDPTEPGH